MRISTAWTQQLGVNSMLKLQEQLANTQSQISSGKQNLKPSDNPISAFKIIELNQVMEQTNQYLRNIDTTLERNILEESSLNSAENLLFRTKELTVQAANGTLQLNDRLAIKAEIDQIIDNLLGIANTRNSNDEYIFAGYATDTKPFAWDDNLMAYEYLGLDSQRALQISEERRVADSDPGFKIFESIPSVSQEASVSGGSRSIFNTLLSLSNALQSSYSDPNAVITSPQIINTPLTLTAGTTVTLDNDISAAPVSITLDGSYDTLDDLVNFINADTALDTDGIKAQSNGRFLEFYSTTTGAISSITISAMTGDFATTTGFNPADNAIGLDLIPTNPDELYFEIMDEVLTDIDSALESLLQARTSVGSRIRTLENQQQQHEKFNFDFQTSLSDIEDLDYTEAITRLTLQETILQASQQSFAQVQNLSLFSFI